MRDSNEQILFHESPPYAKGFGNVLKSALFYAHQCVYRQFYLTVLKYIPGLAYINFDNVVIGCIYYSWMFLRMRGGYYERTELNRVWKERERER